ncbi:MAG: response regulator transcription factor [Candidatus Dormibacteria bacterium]
MGSGNKISVLLVDDHRMFGESVQRLLSASSEISDCRFFANAREAVAGLGERPADVVLVDYSLADTDGPSLTREILERWPKTGVIMVTGSGEDEHVVRAIEAGCHGFLTKDQSSSALVAAIVAVHQGEAAFSPDMLVRAMSLMRHPLRAPGSDLTRRETEVLEALASGRSTPDIAADLFLSPHTVRTHIQTILEKLGAHSKLEAVAIATRSGLVHLS